MKGGENFMKDREPVAEHEIAGAVNRLVEAKKTPASNIYDRAMDNLLKQVTRPGGLKLLDELYGKTKTS